MPAGVYVADCIQNGPVYNAGIQNGDVIVKIGEKNILSMKDYENQLEALHQGDTVTVTVQRKSVNEYKELEYQVNVGAR
ncbi:MAG: PDZ domain-containing protein [Lachnospiraceae bacterium]